MKLTVYFDDSFWCALIEYTDQNGNLIVIKHLFYSEPTTVEVFEFVVKDLNKVLKQEWLIKSDDYAVRNKIKKKMNPKRMQRKINREKKKPVLSTKSEEVLRFQLEEYKKISKKKKSINRKQEKIDQYKIRQKKEN